jgi:hypothetical protein
MLQKEKHPSLCYNNNLKLPPLYYKSSSKLPLLLTEQFSFSQVWHCNKKLLLMFYTGWLTLGGRKSLTATALRITLAWTSASGVLI